MQFYIFKIQFRNALSILCSFIFILNAAISQDKILLQNGNMVQGNIEKMSSVTIVLATEKGKENIDISNVVLIQHENGIVDKITPGLKVKRHRNNFFKRKEFTLAKEANNPININNSLTLSTKLFAEVKYVETGLRSGFEIEAGLIGKSNIGFKLNYFSGDNIDRNSIGIDLIFGGNNLKRISVMAAFGVYATTFRNKDANELLGNFPFDNSSNSDFSIAPGVNASLALRCRFLKKFYATAAIYTHGAIYDLDADDTYVFSASTGANFGIGYIFN